MTLVLVDTSKMPQRGWIIAGSAHTLPRPVSPASTASQRLQNQSPRASDANVYGSASSTLDEQLFDQRASLKINLSRLAMHLSPMMRSSIFDQLDEILDHESWQSDSAFIQHNTFATFLRFLVFVAPARLPSLGVGPTGHLLAAWGSGIPRMAAEFLPDDRAVVAVVKDGTRSAETIIWRGHVVDLKLFAEREGLTECFEDRDDKK